MTQRIERATQLLVHTPRALRTLGRLVVGLMALCLVALVLAPWQQTISGVGRVVARSPIERQQELDAPIEGRVTRWLVHEGARVKKGDLLLELTDNDPAILTRLQEERQALIARRDAASARVQALGSRQGALESSREAGIRAAVRRVDMARERATSARNALEAATAARHTAQLNLDRQHALVDKGLTAQRAVELAQLEAVRTVTEVSRAQAALEAALGEEAALAADRQRAEHDLSAAVDDVRATTAAARAEEANAAAELARLEVRLARQQTMQVVAPADGSVLRVRAGVGTAFVKAGEPLLTLVPDTTERAVEVWIDGNDLPLVSEGRPVRLQFEGWPAVQFSGWPSVAVGTFGGTVSLIDAADDGQGRFRLVVTPDEGGWPPGALLRQGVRVNGWVLLDQVRLGYELWRRFNGFPPTITQPQTKAKGGA